jgi:arylsulfatase A-like enzyme
VYDNTVFPWHHSLDPAIATIGSQLGAGGYRSSYIGKWHLTGGPTPPMDLYGYADWDGNDQHFMGWAGTGVHFDPVIAESAARWLDAHGTQAEPWFLTVALVNPHDVMWFPMDQPSYQSDHPDELAATEALLDAAKWKDGAAVPPFTDAFDDVVEGLPESFGDDLLTKPACHRQWRWDQQHWLAGYLPPDDREQWRRQLDYYVKLHQLADDSLGTVLAALERSGAWDDTVIIFTSDHGDMCGSHGLRSKGPFVYDEIMRVPCYVKPAASSPEPAAAGRRSTSLSSHVDLARTICGIAGVEPESE